MSSEYGGKQETGSEGSLGPEVMPFIAHILQREKGLSVGDPEVFLDGWQNGVLRRGEGGKHVSSSHCPSLAGIIEAKMAGTRGRRNIYYLVLQKCSFTHNLFGVPSRCLRKCNRKLVRLTTSSHESHANSHLSESPGCSGNYLL